MVALAGLIATTTIGVSGAGAAARSGGSVKVTATSTAGSQAQIGAGVQITNTTKVTGSAASLELGRAALAQLRVDWENLYPGWTIAFLPGRANYLGMTLVPERRVEIYVRSDRSVTATAHDLAHELGHVTDVMYNTDASRQRFLSLRGLAVDTPWWTCSGCRDLQVPAGDFAETFALAAAPHYRFYSELAPEPTSAAMGDFVETVLPSVVRSRFTPVNL